MQGNNRLPANLAAERTILGAVLLDNVAFDLVAGAIKPNDFSLDSHKKIAQTMAEMRNQGRAIDIVTLSDELGKRQWVQLIGGIAYLCSLTEGLPRHPAIEEYLRIVKDRSMLRAAMIVGEQTMAAASEQTQPAIEVIRRAQSELLAIEDSLEVVPGLQAQCDSTFERIMRERSGEITRYIPSGLDWIDQDVGGLAKGRLTVIAARPKVGKSALLRFAIIVNCMQGNFSHLVTLEMTVDEVLRMIYSVAARVPFRCIEHPQTLNQKQVEALERVKDEVAQWPLRIEASKTFTGDDIASLARIVKRKHNTQLFGLDYLQKVNWRAMDKNNRWNAYTDTITMMANISQECDMATVVISSLSESHGANLNAPPTFNDLRGSGDIKFEVAQLYLLHREQDEQNLGVLKDAGYLINPLSRFEQAGSRPIRLDKEFVYFESMENMGLADGF